MAKQTIRINTPKTRTKKYYSSKGSIQKRCTSCGRCM